MSTNKRTLSEADIIRSRLLAALLHEALDETEPTLEATQ